LNFEYLFFLGFAGCVVNGEELYKEYKVAQSTIVNGEET
jgi:hypothetical protein